MKVSKKKLDDGRLQLEAIADVDEVQRVFESAGAAFMQKMGIRPVPDKTMQQVAEERMGIKDLDSVVEQSALELMVPFALDKCGVIPAYQPQPMASSQLKRGQKFSFRVFVMPKPDYELKSYDPVEVVVGKFEPDYSQVDTRLAEMAERYGEYEDIESDRGLQAGDTAKISIDAYQNGERMTGLCTDGRTYSVGEGYMPEGFEEAVLGMKPGETKKFTFEGPGWDENGNEVTEVVDCTVKVLSLQQKVTPVIDDAWVKKYMPMFANLKDFTKEIKKGIEAEQRQMYDNLVLNLISGQLSQRFEGKIPDEVYEAAQQGLLKDMREQVAQANMTWDNFIEQQGGAQQFQMMMMLETRNQVVKGYCLDAVFRHEGLVLNEDDVKAACREINPRDPNSVRQGLESTGRGFVLRELAERYKASRWLLDHVIIKEPPKEDEKKDEQKDE